MAPRSSNKLRRLALIAAVLALALAAAAGLAMRQSGASGDDRPPLGLFTTLPIYWNEASGISDLLDENQPTPWVRRLLDARYRLQPLDLLEPAGAGRPDPLKPYPYLLLAQPRALSAGENVALDRWVRAGGRLLLFADPLLTAESIHPLGDARRPQDAVLLSPILGHWGLRLEFDEEQPGGERPVTLFGASVPVDLAGRLVAQGGAKGSACTILAEGLVADCRIGKGAALIVADAGLLDGTVGEPGSREAALNRLLDRAFAAK